MTSTTSRQRQARGDYVEYYYQRGHGTIALAKALGVGHSTVTSDLDRRLPGRSRIRRREPAMEPPPFDWQAAVRFTPPADAVTIPPAEPGAVHADRVLKLLAAHAAELDQARYLTSFGSSVARHAGDHRWVRAAARVIARAGSQITELEAVLAGTFSPRSGSGLVSSSLREHPTALEAHIMGYLAFGLEIPVRDMAARHNVSEDHVRKITGLLEGS